MSTEKKRPVEKSQQQPPSHTPQKSHPCKQRESLPAINRQTFRQRMASYRRHPFSLFLSILVVASAGITLSVLVALIIYIVVKGMPNLKPSLFAWEYNSENVSMLPAIINTLFMTALSLLLAVPLGIFSAVYLTEYARRGNKLVNLIRITAETLSGIPSIVYGLFGMLIFNVACGFGFSLLSGALTLAIMILPLIMRTTEEALLAVPDSYREGSFGLGAGKLRTVFRVIFPSAIPGILSGVILGIGRIVGETAALIYTAGTATSVATNLLASGRTLSVHTYRLMNEGLHIEEAYASAFVLLVMVIIINSISGWIAKHFNR